MCPYRKVEKKYKSVSCSYCQWHILIIILKLAILTVHLVK